MQFLILKWSKMKYTGWTDHLSRYRSLKQTSFWFKLDLDQQGLIFKLAICFYCSWVLCSCWIRNLYASLISSNNHSFLLRSYICSILLPSVTVKGQWHKGAECESVCGNQWPSYSCGFKCVSVWLTSLVAHHGWIHTKFNSLWFLIYLCYNHHHHKKGKNIGCPENDTFISLIQIRIIRISIIQIMIDQMSRWWYTWTTFWSTRTICINVLKLSNILVCFWQ